jgi:hypothetical protein
VLMVVDDFSRYSHARDLILRLQNEFPKMS